MPSTKPCPYCRRRIREARDLLSLAFGTAIATLLILTGLVAVLGAAAIKNLDRPAASAER